MSDYDDALSRALAYTDETGLSDGTDRPAGTVAELGHSGLVEITTAEVVPGDRVLNVYGNLDTVDHVNRRGSRVELHYTGGTWWPMFADDKISVVRP